MKKSLIIVMVIALVCALAACGGAGEEASNMVLNEDGQQIVIDRDEVKVTVAGKGEDEVVGQYLDLFVENNTDSEIMVQTKDGNANDEFVSASFSLQLKPGETGTGSLFYRQEDSAGNIVEDLEKINLKFDVFNPETYETLFISDEVTIVIPE